MKAAIVCQDVYEYNIQATTFPLKSGTGAQKNMHAFRQTSIQ